MANASPTPNSENLTPGSKAGRQLGPSRCLKNMREVWADPEGDGGGQTIEALRVRFAKDPLEFGKELQAMELAWRKECRLKKAAAKRVAAVPVPTGEVAGPEGANTGVAAPVFDAGTERALALIAQCQARGKGDGGRSDGGDDVPKLFHPPGQPAPAAVPDVLRRPRSPGEVPGGARRADD